MLSSLKAAGDVSQTYTLHASLYLVKSANFSGFLEQIDTFLKYWQTNRIAPLD